MPASAVGTITTTINDNHPRGIRRTGLTWPPRNSVAAANAPPGALTVGMPAVDWTGGIEFGPAAAGAPLRIVTTFAGITRPPAASGDGGSAPYRHRRRATGPRRRGSRHNRNIAGRSAGCD